MVELIINGSSSEVRTEEDLSNALRRLGDSQFSEVWLCTPQGGPSLCALINGKFAWLMYLRHPNGDAGFSTRNPLYVGPREAMVEFRFSNGQMDNYPAAWDITTEEAVRALRHFFTTLDRAPWLEWHDDSVPRADIL